MFVTVKESLQGMEEMIEEVTANMEDFKKNPQRTANWELSSVHSTPQVQSILLPALIYEDYLSSGIEGIREANTLNKTVEPGSCDKIRIKPVTEEFLKLVFLENKYQRHFWHQCIVPVYHSTPTGQNN